MEKINAKFEVGEECYCEFKKAVIMETTVDGRITDVKVGGFRCGSTDLSDMCFPINEETTRIANNIQFWSDEFHGSNFNSLNYPDLRRFLMIYWKGLCENIGNEEKSSTLYKELEYFGNTVMNKIKEVQEYKIGDIKIFGR